ncbi:MAG: O-antigen ligase family protein [Planctomycetales bacterium]
MLYNLELALYCLLSVSLLMMAFQRPIWAVAFYLLNYFAQPPYWPWGGPLPLSMRWSLFAGFVLLSAIALRGRRSELRSDSDQSRITWCILLMLANATVVHYAMARYVDESFDVYIEMVKFVVLFFLIVAAVTSRRDFFLFVWFLAIGLGYWGFEAWIRGEAVLDQGRLENFGGPGCDNSNELASITVTLLAIIGGMVFVVKGMKKLVITGCTIFGLNIMMLCNSRGGFASLIAVGLTVPMVASGKARRLAVRGLLLGTVAVLLLAGNPEIMDRFFSSLQTRAEAERKGMRAVIDVVNVESRIEMWDAGFDLVSDHPFGNGGEAFNSDFGNEYLIKNRSLWRYRSVHQGFIDEAIEWGLQGLVLRMALIAAAVCCAYRTMHFRRRIGDEQMALFGACLIGGFSGWLASCLFGEFMHLEWGYWLLALAAAYGKIFGQTNYGILKDTLVEQTDVHSEEAEMGGQTAAARV